MVHFHFSEKNQQTEKRVTEFTLSIRTSRTVQTLHNKIRCLRTSCACFLSHRNVLETSTSNRLSFSIFGFILK